MYLVSSLSLPEFTMNFTSSLQATVLQFANRETLSMMTDGHFNYAPQCASAATPDHAAACLPEQYATSTHP
jgi:hypothetical protein